MFSNGKFKNTVASDECADVPIPGNGGSLEKEYLLHPIKARTKNWIALEDSLGSAINKSEGTLSSTVVCVSPEDRNVFAIYVTYYVKVKLLIGAMGGQMSLKLPFTLMHTPSNTYPAGKNIFRQLGNLLIIIDNVQKLNNYNLPYLFYMTILNYLN